MHSLGVVAAQHCFALLEGARKHVAGAEGSSVAKKTGHDYLGGSCQLLLFRLARFVVSAASDGRGTSDAQAKLLAAAPCVIKS
jgi:hypothetical protein